MQPVWRIKGQWSFFRGAYQSRAAVNVCDVGSADSEAVAGGPYNVTNLRYTVMVVDANIPGTTNSTTLVRHYLQVRFIRPPPSLRLKLTIYPERPHVRK